MVRKGLPKQGAKAILDAFSDANEEMLKQKKQKDKSDNERLRDWINNDE